ncbi:MAG TPA: amino acid ABC transporter substrate-binding protein [Euzebyales bacterium]|nr:amino acid ABC transporter substrate-binding protein [Euzebyales bacterium]
MRRGRTRTLLILFVILAIAAACSPAGDGESALQPGAGDASAPAPEPAGTEGGEAGGDAIRFAASLPLTGEFSIPGAKHRDGYQYCVDLINEAGGLLDRPVELLTNDNRSDTEVAVSQYERFINAQQVDLLLGTFSSLLTFPTSTVAEQAGMVYPVASGGALRIWERGYENIFYFQQEAAETVGESPVNAIGEYVEQGTITEAPQTAAVIYAEDFFAAAIAAGLLGHQVEVPGSDEMVDLAPGYLADAGIEAVLEEEWPVDFNGWLQLANTIRNADADALFVATASPDEAIEMVRALQTVGYQPDIMYMSQGTQSEFGQTLGDAANGIMAHAAWHPDAAFEGLLNGEPITNEEFIDGFTEAYDRPPDEDEAIPFAVCQGMEQAVRATGTTDNAEIRAWMQERTADDPVRTIMGDFHWDDRGLPEGRDVVLTQWQEGELRFVYPTGEFEGVVDMIYPKPQW